MCKKYVENLQHNLNSCFYDKFYTYRCLYRNRGKTYHDNRFFVHRTIVDNFLVYHMNKFLPINIQQKIYVIEMILPDI